GAEGYEGGILKAIKIADSPEEFADKILELLCNKELREDMGHITRIEVEKRYKWGYVFSDMDKTAKIPCNRCSFILQLL
ncbi:MAG: hypothetical protein Q8N67_01295, partial [Candidatus Omnitrophota bacterium]|nr:hypothetical protein [Candidatus Omnitrophota bacterium]